MKRLITPQISRFCLVGVLLDAGWWRVADSVGAPGSAAEVGSDLLRRPSRFVDAALGVGALADDVQRASGPEPLDLLVAEGVQTLE